MKPETDYRTEKATRLQVKRNDYSGTSNKDSNMNDREERKREMMAKLHDLRMKVSTPSKARESLEIKYESKVSSKIESKQSSSHKNYEPKPRGNDTQIDPAILDRLSNLENIVMNVKHHLQNQSSRKPKSRNNESKIREIGENMERLEGICENLASSEENQIEIVVLKLFKKGFQLDSTFRRTKRESNDSRRRSQ